jgi:uncharacterized membrane protein
MTAVCVAALYAKSRWAIVAPVYVGFAGTVISVSFAALLFVRDHGRQLLPTERRLFTIGCFLAVWFCSDFLIIVSRMLTHTAWSTRQVVTAIIGTGVDFIFVWALVRYLLPWMLAVNAAQENDEPPNNRWSGP